MGTDVQNFRVPGKRHAIYVSPVSIKNKIAQKRFYHFA